MDTIFYTRAYFLSGSVQYPPIVSFIPVAKDLMHRSTHLLENEPFAILASWVAGAALPLSIVGNTVKSMLLVVGLLVGLTEGFAELPTPTGTGVKAEGDGVKSRLGISLPVIVGLLVGPTVALIVGPLVGSVLGLTPMLGAEVGASVPKPAVGAKVGIVTSLGAEVEADSVGGELDEAAAVGAEVNEATAVGEEVDEVDAVGAEVDKVDSDKGVGVGSSSVEVGIIDSVGAKVGDVSSSAGV